MNNVGPTQSPPRGSPVVVAFNGCGLPRLRGLVESLLLSMEGVDPTCISWIEGLSEQKGRSTPLSLAASLTGRRVAMLCADPREAVLANYRVLRVERRSTGCSMDDLLCARAPDDGPLTPECRLGLRACVDFMSAIAISQGTFESYLEVHASDLENDPWALAERIVRFAGLRPSEADLTSAGRRAGPLGRPGAACGGTLPVFPLELSSGQKVFAAGVIAEHLHPTFCRYRAGSRRTASRAA